MSRIGQQGVPSRERTRRCRRDAIWRWRKTVMCSPVDESMTRVARGPCARRPPAGRPIMSTQARSGRSRFLECGVELGDFPWVRFHSPGGRLGNLCEEASQVGAVCLRHGLQDGPCCHGLPRGRQACAQDLVDDGHEACWRGRRAVPDGLVLAQDGESALPVLHGGRVDVDFRGQPAGKVLVHDDGGEPVQVRRGDRCYAPRAKHDGGLLARAQVLQVSASSTHLRVRASGVDGGRAAVVSADRMPRAGQGGHEALPARRQVHAVTWGFRVVRAGP